MGFSLSLSLSLSLFLNASCARCLGRKGFPGLNFGRDAINMHPFSSVSSVAQSCLTLCDPMDCSTPDLPIHHQVLELAQTHVHQVGDAIQPSVAPLSSCLQSFPASGSFPMSQFFASGGPKYWSFNFRISPSNEYSGLISLKIDWFDLLTVQGTLKSLLQHHSSSALSFLYGLTLTSIYDYWKNIALTRRTFVSKVMSLLFNILSRLVIASLPRSKRLLISWLQSPSAVILEPKKIKSLTASIVSPSICHEVMGPDAMILVF